MREIIFLQELNKMVQLALDGKIDINKLTPAEREEVEASRRGVKGGDIHQTAQDEEYYNNMANNSTGEKQNHYKQLAKYTKTIKDRKIANAHLQSNGQPRYDVNDLTPQEKVAGNTPEERTQNTINYVEQKKDKVESQPGQSVIDRRTGGERGYINRNKQTNVGSDAERSLHTLQGNLRPDFYYKHRVWNGEE